jgi:glycosyltransferase involved in cell wall biosynthesis
MMRAAVMDVLTPKDVTEQAAKARVAVGLPVYNGERFLAAAIDSVLAQTFQDFEIIISDNASTDSTRKICLEYAAADPRVRYYRNDRNIGGVRNFNRVVEFSSSELFMWFADDDVIAPTYLEKCIAALDRDPSVILSFSSFGDIDAEGKLLDTRKSSLVMDSPDPVERFRHAIRMEHLCEPWCAVTRTEILKKTPLYGIFADYDRVLLAELGLYGRFFEVNEFLFFHREHENRSINLFPGRYERMAWIDPKRVGKVTFPHLRQFREYLAAIGRSPISFGQKLECYKAMLGWLKKNRSRIYVDMKIAGREMFRPVWSKVTEEDSKISS